MGPIQKSPKIIFIITDGFPNSKVKAKAAIWIGEKLGMEIYGLSFGQQMITDLLPGRSAVIDDILEQPQILFAFLEQVLITPK